MMMCGAALLVSLVITPTTTTITTTTDRATCNGTLHFSHWIRPGGSWHPEYLTPLHLPLILEKVRAKRAFWARKVDAEKGGAALMDALDYRRLCGAALDSEV